MKKQIQSKCACCKKKAELVNRSNYCKTCYEVQRDRIGASVERVNAKEKKRGRDSDYQIIDEYHSHNGARLLKVELTISELSAVEFALRDRINSLRGDLLLVSGDEVATAVVKELTDDSVSAMAVVKRCLESK